MLKIAPVFRGFLIKDEHGMQKRMWSLLYYTVDFFGNTWYAGRKTRRGKVHTSY